MAVSSGSAASANDVLGLASAQHRGRLYAASQTVATASWVKVQVSSEAFDKGNIADPTNYKITTDTAGWWAFGASLATDSFSAAHTTKIAITNADASPTTSNTLVQHSYPTGTGVHGHTMSDFQYIDASVPLYLWYQFDASTSHGINTMALWAYLVTAV